MIRKRRVKTRKLSVGFSRMGGTVGIKDKGEDIYLFPVELVKKDLMRTIWLTIGAIAILLGFWIYL